jgi:hypothetical protein
MVAKSSWWKAAKGAGILGVVGLLYLVLSSIGFRDIFQAMREASTVSLVLASALTICVFLLWALRLELLMPREERASIVLMFPIYMAGVFGNIITPGARVGGEPIRAYYMQKSLGGKTSTHFGLLLADKLGNMSVYMVYLLISVAFVALYVPIRLELKIALEALVLLAIGAAISGVLLREHIGVESGLLGKVMRLLYHMPILTFFRNRFETYKHFEDYVIEKLDDVLKPIIRAARSPKALAKIVVFSGGSWMVFYLAHYLLFVALDARLSFFEVFIIVSIANFVGDMGFSPGGAGFMETAMLGLCAAFGVTHHTAAAVTLISRGIFYLCGLSLGGLSLLGLSLLYGRGKATPPEQEPEGELAAEEGLPAAED